MKNSRKINNLMDLRAEIVRLNVRKSEQEAYLVNQYHLLKNKIQGPIRFISNITSSIPGVGMVKGVVSGISKAAQGKDSDWLTKTLQIGTPFILNSTLLKNAGKIKKALVLLASEAAVGQVNQRKISGFINKVAGFIKPKKKKKKDKEVLATDEDLIVEEGVRSYPINDGPTS